MSKQKPYEWRRTKRRSFYQTDLFVLGAKKGRNGWSAYVDVAGCDEPLMWGSAPVCATREQAEEAACEVAHDLASELRRAARSLERERAKARLDAEAAAPPTPPEPEPYNPEPLTLAGIKDSEAALLRAGIHPPYSLRAPQWAIEELLSSPDGKKVDREPAECPTLHPGERLMGKASKAFLIAVATPSEAPST